MTFPGSVTSLTSYHENTSILHLDTGASIHMGQGDTSPQYLDWGTLSRMSPQYFYYSNISYFLSMQYCLDKLKEFLVFLVFSRLVQEVVGTL